MRPDELRMRAQAAFALLICLTGVTCSTSASADRSTDALVLAQMCAGEASPSQLGTCTAMVGVIQRTASARGVSVATQARAYSAVFRSGRRPWLLELNARGTRPEHWPRASWSRYRPTWMALLAHVRGVLSGEVAPVCEESRHFGSVRLDGHRMRDFARVCPELGDGRQGFWGGELTLLRRCDGCGAETNGAHSAPHDVVRRMRGKA